MNSQPPAQKRARHQVSLPYSSTAPEPPSFPSHPGSLTPIDCNRGASQTGENQGFCWTGEKLTNWRSQVTLIDTLPDDILLAIFNFYVNNGFQKERQKAWQSLVHLVCAERTPARDTLDVWPALPLIIMSYGDHPTGNVDNIIAVLEHTDRVCQIYFNNVRSSYLEIFLAAMQQPFPELTNLLLSSDKMVPVIPDSFLGGSAPRLQSINFSRIPLPNIPKLLLSATHLVHLILDKVPHSGYFSPDAMVTALSTLASLKRLTLYFQSPRSSPDQASRRLPPSTHTVLPVLTMLTFKGVSEYLDDLLACINAPQLNGCVITFFNDTVFDTPQIIQFISRTPNLGAPSKVRIELWDNVATVNFSSQTSTYGRLHVSILCRKLDWQVSSLEQVCTSCLPPFSMLEDLYIIKNPPQLDWKDDTENRPWLELLYPFTTVKNLYLAEKVASRIVPALQELVEGRATDVLPTLQNIFLEVMESSGPVHEGIGQFVAARQVASCPITVSRWAEEDMVFDW